MTTDERRWTWAKTLATTAVALGVAAGVLSVIGGRSAPSTGSAHVAALALQVPSRQTLVTPTYRTGPLARHAGLAGKTPAGAVAAAAEIVSDEPLLVGADAGAAIALVDSWAAPAARQGLEEAFLAARDGFVHAKGGPFSFDVGLLADRIDTARPGRVVLDAWCAEVVLDREEPTAGVYVTERMGLTWTAGGWRLNSITDTPGPSVGLSGTPTPATEAAAALAGNLRQHLGQLRNHRLGLEPEGLRNEMRRAFCNRVKGMGLRPRPDLRASLRNFFPVRYLRSGLCHEPLAQTRESAARGTVQARLHGRAAAPQRIVRAAGAPLLLSPMQVALHGLWAHGRGPR